MSSCRQEGLSKASLVQWTKGFCCSGVEGEDVCRLLRYNSVYKFPTVIN